MSKKAFILLLSFAISIPAICQQIKGHYAIKNVQTGMLIRVKDAHSENGTPLVAYDPQNWKCMTWEFNTTGSNVYQLQNLLTGKTFQPAQMPDAGVGLVEEPIGAETAYQQWEFIRDRDDKYFIRLKGTSWYLTPEDKKGSTNSRIVLAARSNTPDQLWRIYQQEPTM